MKGGLLLIFLFFLIGQSCMDPDLVVTRDMKRAVDTLYRNQRDVLIDELDSMCLIKSKEIYPILLDSVIQVRKEERNRILKKNTK